MRYCSILVASLLMMVLTSCLREPRSLTWGTHACDFCKMKLMDNHYGALLETQKGRIYRFDDINCMLRYDHEDRDAVQYFPVKLVVDYARPGTLIPAEDAFYLKSPELITPMDSKIVAFSSKPDFDLHKKKLKGIYLVWGELVTQFR